MGPSWIALEAGALMGLFLALPRGRATAVAASLASLAVVGVVILELGDTATRMSLSRPLNLYLDVRLASSVVHLLDGSLGTMRSRAALVGSALLAVVTLVGLSFALYRLAREEGRSWLPGVLVILVFSLAIPLRWVHPRGVVAALPAADLLREQRQQLRLMLEERKRFSGELAAAPAAAPSVGAPLAGLDGRDVVLAFLESYGLSALTDARYAPLIRPRLERIGETLAAEGVSVVSGLLEAPSQGGMSWLGHGSFLSGLWLDNQLRYDLLLSSDRTTLVDDFREAGYRTVAVMPAITLAWPEGERLGYEEIWAHKDIDYRGPPLNWVTMPDQFTWSFLENTVRAVDDSRPLFVELGLISSHAPWTPILDVLDDWDAVGNGEVFARWESAGERPEDLWRDHDRVREHYALAVGYALDVVGSYAARYLNKGSLLIVLGDHQPAPLITGDGATRAVPVHVLAAERHLLEPFLSWGFVDGTVPDADRGARRMDAFRGWFLAAYGNGSATGVGQ